MSSGVARKVNFSMLTLGCCMAAADVVDGCGTVGGCNIKKMIRNV